MSSPASNERISVGVLPIAYSYRYSRTDIAYELLSLNPNWIPADPTDLKRGVGVFAHEPSNTLWVCSADPDANNNTTMVRAFDLKTAALRSAYPFPGGGFCNDIAVTHDGTALVTDTRGGRI